MAERVNTRIGRVQLTSVETGHLFAKTIVQGCLALKVVDSKYFKQYYGSPKSDSNVYPCETCRAVNGLTNMHTAKIAGRSVTMICHNLKGKEEGQKLETKVDFQVTGRSQALGGFEVDPQEVADYLKRSGLVSCS